MGTQTKIYHLIKMFTTNTFFTSDKNVDFDWPYICIIKPILENMIVVTVKQLQKELCVVYAIAIYIQKQQHRRPLLCNDNIVVIK